MRHFRLLAALAVLLMLGGCSGADDTQARSEPPAMAEAPASTDELFLQTVHETRPSTRAYDDALVIDVAKAACRIFDDGGTVDGLRGAVLGTTLDVEDAGVIIGAGVGAHCPEHNSKVRN